MNSFASLEESGFALVRGVVSRQECERLIAALGPVGGAGRRGLLAQPAVAELAVSAPLLSLMRAHLRIEPCPVRAIYFDKQPGTNWLVTWHQDLTLAMRTQVDVPGYGPWSVKDEAPCVQPPIERLEQMVALRLHLDDCVESNGALRVLPGTHRLGRLSANRIQRLKQEIPEFVCCASAGDVLIMRPLLLHASSRSQSPSHRRVLHIEYAGFELPEALEWHERTKEKAQPAEVAPKQKEALKTVSE